MAEPLAKPPTARIPSFHIFYHVVLQCYEKCRALVLRTPTKLITLDPDGLGTNFSTRVLFDANSDGLGTNFSTGFWSMQIRMGWVPTFRLGFGQCRFGWVGYQLFDRVLIDADSDGLGTKFSTS